MSADSLASLGKGMVQINLRLSRVLELLERPQATAAAADEGETQAILFDLLDALDRALERPPPRRSWLSRHLGGEVPDDGLRRGIELARERALGRLRRRGVEVIDTSGRFDPALHEAIERVPAPAGAAASPGTIARTHRTGFVAREGDGRRVLRLAQVSVHGASIGPAARPEELP